jgi:metal-responsive CopG/Arc/MetJ family transcriptional regulator
MVDEKKPRYANIKIRTELANEIDKIVSKSRVYSTRVDVVKRALSDFFEKEEF